VPLPKHLSADFAGAGCRRWAQRRHLDWRRLLGAKVGGARLVGRRGSTYAGV